MPDTQPPWSVLLDDLESYVMQLDAALASGTDVPLFELPTAASLPAEALERLTSLQQLTTMVLERYSKAMSVSQEELLTVIRTPTVEAGSYLNEHA